MLFSLFVFGSNDSHFYQSINEYTVWWQILRILIKSVFGYNIQVTTYNLCHHTLKSITYRYWTWTWYWAETGQLENYKFIFSRNKLMFCKRIKHNIKNPILCCKKTCIFILCGWAAVWESMRLNKKRWKWQLVSINKHYQFGIEKDIMSGWSTVLRGTCVDSHCIYGKHTRSKIMGSITCRRVRNLPFKVYCN